MNPTWTHPDGTIRLWQGDCRDVLATLPDSSVALILVDPPYFKVKDEWWDRQWDTSAGFCQWIGTLCDEWQRVLRPNGSLYCFASPAMAWHVEGEIRQRFNVLNRIIWRKEEGIHWRQNEESLRSYFPQTEAIIFAEQFGRVSLPWYMRTAREAAGFTLRQVAEAIGCDSRLVDKWETQRGERDACEPTREQFVMATHLYGVRDEYEDLRRPFDVSHGDQYTDVWDFPTVGAYKGKHPCEKPRDMIRHIIEASSRPGDVVLDCFAGSGVVGKACRDTGRAAWLCEIDAKWCAVIQHELEQPRLFAPRVASDRTEELPLFEPQIDKPKARQLPGIDP